MSNSILKKLRIQKMYTQNYVANRLHISQPEYSRLENGERNVNLEKLQELSVLYGIEKKHILEGLLNEEEC